MADTSERWCILRTSGSRTLMLANSLAAAGFDVWTPRETVEWRRPRSNERLEREVPIMPSFVFVRSRELPDLVRLLSLPVSPHPQFSIFQFAGRVPMLSDASMQAVKKVEADLAEALANKRAAAQRRADIEAQKQARKVKRDLAIGGAATVAAHAAFVGVTGVLQASDGRDAWIKFGAMTIKVDAWHVLPVEVSASAEAA